MGFKPKVRHSHAGMRRGFCSDSPKPITNPPESFSVKFYIVKRLLLIGPTVLGVAVLVFFLMRVIPGDICLARWVDYGTDLDPSLLEFCRNDLGLNAPLHVQFLQFI